MAAPRDILSTFASTTPDVEYITPSSSTFEETRAIYAHPEIVPSGILRPANIPALASTVSFLAANKIEFTVRGGGHDLQGRSMKKDTVAVDLRLINHVRIDADTATAKVGGGTLAGDLIRTLEKEGFVTPVGSVSPVGYTGWAMYGGYGAYSSRFGLGVDHIVGARVVNATGEVVDADAELLKAIRGAGGAFGVLAEVTISIYKLAQILAGVVIFNSQDLDTVIRQYNQGYRVLTAAEGGLPAPLSLQQCTLNMPTPTFGVLFMWADEDHEAGKQWLERVSGLAPVVANTVKSRTPSAWQAEQDALVPKTTQGRLWSVNLRQITDEVAGVIAQYAKQLPADPHVIFDMHELRGDSPSAKPNADSVFVAREGHFAVEIVPLVEDAEKLEGALAWGQEFSNALKRTDPRNIVAATYVSFLTADEFDHDKVFGEHLGFLRRVKARVDPGNVFNNAISYL
ncbi:FAD-binding oxidoreductase [Aspergillus lucknowensis]|uniref:FAD-binding domain-containing protein n=1 Tax=Aspergillus lucknowensis TaxID=176173 RepID=A0ABR4LPN6_9EURO